MNLITTVPVTVCKHGHATSCVLVVAAGINLWPPRLNPRPMVQVETLARQMLKNPIEIQVGGRSVVNSDITQVRHQT